jgi:YD repeat-containing protein
MIFARNRRPKIILPAPFSLSNSDDPAICQLALRSRSDRPNRSNFQTTRQSSFRTNSNALCNSTLFAVEPLVVSTNIFSHPALFRLAGKYYYESVAAWNDGSGAASQSIVYTYDLWGRVVKEADSKNGVTATVYHNEGQVARLASPRGVINYEYDRITGQVPRTWTGTDAANPMTDVWNAYDALGRLETVTTYAREGAALSTPETARYVYDLIGNLDKIVQANGVVSDYEYDNLNRLKELTHYQPDSTPEDLANNPVLQRYAYDYNPDGNQAKETFTDVSGAVHT